jgi:uncharacterized membrane protein YesL
MGNFFNTDSPIFSILSKVSDMLFISITFIFLCIPIVTIGPASTALYYTIVKVIRRERGYIFREFFKSFKMNFKRGAIVGIIFTLIFFVLTFDLLYAYGLTVDPNSSKGSLLLGVFGGVTFLVASLSIYIFPILSRFDMTVRQLIKAAAYMSMRHIPFTIIMLLVNALSLVLIYFFIPFIFIAPATIVLVNSFLMERVLKKYMPESEQPEDDKSSKWYLE